MNAAPAKMYATDFDDGVGLGDALQACLDGANTSWHGTVQAFFDEQAMFRLSFVDGDVTAESVGLVLGVVDRRVRLITVVVEDPTGARTTRSTMIPPDRSRRSRPSARTAWRRAVHRSA